MAKKPLKVETLAHKDAKRRNIPTAEFESIMREEDKSPIRIAYERRNRDLDPQLVWRGKDEQDWSDLVVQAPPLYIQEKVHPKVLIDDLMRFRRPALRGGAADEATRPGSPRRDAARDDVQPDLFADFNGLPDLEAKTEFYAHDQNWSNRMILGDSLQVMASLAEREGLRGKVQCIYLDPPYGIKFNSNFQWSTTSRDVKDGNAAHITREPEQVKAFRDTWRDGIHSYLTYLRDRLTVARDLLHESGSIFVQIGDENVHRARALMDEVFGESNFVSEIVFAKTTGQTTDLLAPSFDVLLWFAKNKETVKYRRLFREKTVGGEGAVVYTQIEDIDLQRRRLSAAEIARGILTGKLFATSDIRSQSGGSTTSFLVAFDGRSYIPGKGYWKTSEDGFVRLLRANRVTQGGTTIRYIRYFDDNPVFNYTNYWGDTGTGSFTVDKTYVVQTGTKTVERCILMTTDPGDLVLDPTCGSGTTAYVAEQWGRRWITIDTSRVALALARARIMGARYPYYLLADSPEGQKKEWEVSGKPPPSLRGGEVDEAIQKNPQKTANTGLLRSARNDEGEIARNDEGETARNDEGETARNDEGETARNDERETARNDEREIACNDEMDAARDDENDGAMRTQGDIRLGFVYERVPHITLKSIANNAEIDVIWERLQPDVEAARAELNAALRGHFEPFAVETGGRAGTTIDFRATGEVKLPCGEPARTGGFMEWEVPREPGTPWPEKHRRLWAKAHAVSKDASRKKQIEAEHALADLNRLRGANFTFETLPAQPLTPWPKEAEAALSRFWEARIARQKDIDASIAAKADIEYLYDKPYIDNSRIRVAGPFTVETLSPHRVLAVDHDDELIDTLEASSGGRAAPKRSSDETDFATLILENLKTSGVQQAHKEDRITFTALTGWPGDLICAEGRFMEGDKERRAGIFIGPEFGTVARADLVAAAREAGEAGFDMLIACAFNYNAHSAELDKLGRIPVLKARMNADLHMAADLKNTGKGNLFVIFGEPDIGIEDAGEGQIRVKINGVDVFHPQTGEITSSGSEGIACWFIDTDYNEESFFVRHAYFLGANDPYKALKTTLKAEINADAWESLNSDTSRPFAKPSTGRIAVKVINYLGDEVMKVFSVG